ncbi:helix-turn-helix domain-containing protein [Massilia sp. B-10]|nr:helix-turn-helix domain-containing protein [Massilia sp. B-10]
MLKARGITYGELAARIDMSEASVKRMFSQKNFTLLRLDDILSASGIEFEELSAAQSGPALISQLTLAQEREIIGDPRLLVVAVSAMNHISFDDIVRYYEMTELEVTKYLLRLDKIGFLELLPNNRVKLLIARTFQLDRERSDPDLLPPRGRGRLSQLRFDGEDEVLRLVNVMLSKQSAGCAARTPQAGRRRILPAASARNAAAAGPEARHQFYRRGASVGAPGIQDAAAQTVIQPIHRTETHMSQSSQFSLLKQRRFAPFFWTQFLGAFNDNVFKTAFLVVLTFDAAKWTTLDPSMLTNLIPGLFILPYVLFSATAYQIVEKVEKGRLARIVKLIEIGIMLVA